MELLHVCSHKEIRMQPLKKFNLKRGSMHRMECHLRRVTNCPKVRCQII